MRNEYGQFNNYSRFNGYATGKHVPREETVKLVEGFAPGSARYIKHVLWPILGEDIKFLIKNAPALIQLLSSDVVKLILDSAGNIRFETGYHYLMALEKRRNFDGLAALTLLLRLSIADGKQEQIREYAFSLLRVLLYIGQTLIDYKVAEALFALYVDRIFSQVRYHGVRFDLSTYPFSSLAKELSFQISKRVNNPKFRERPEEIATKIQAGYYAQFFKYASAPIIILDTEKADICVEFIEQIERENQLRGESLLLLEAPSD